MYTLDCARRGNAFATVLSRKNDQIEGHYLVHWPCDPYQFIGGSIPVVDVKASKLIAAFTTQFIVTAKTPQRGD